MANMSNKHYRYISEVINDKSSSYVPDVAFHPNGSTFGVSFRDKNEIRMYDSSTIEILRTYKNPQSELSFPHGIVIADHHIIVSNKLNSSSISPASFTVYRLDDPSSKPVSIFETPLEHLREAHSLDLHNGKLVVTYAGRKTGAILTYLFDDKTGIISGPTSILDGFSAYGEPKGLCFFEDGRKIIITIVSEHPNTHQHQFSGLAIFDVDEDGKLSNKPVQTIPMQGSRLENINIVDNTCVLADPINNSVYVYQIDSFNHPSQIIQEKLPFPHDACLSPDKKMLIVTNYGIKVVDQQPQWRTFCQPRSDKITIFKLTE